MRIRVHASSLAIVCMAMLGASQAVRAEPRDCDNLPANKKALARTIFAVLHPYAGCDETFARCLSAKPPRPVVLRLAADICRQVNDGSDRKMVEHSLTERAQTMLPTGPRATFALDEATRAGAADAPVTVVVYACSRCPFCKVMVTELYAAVSKGPLQGKVRFYLRPFPLKSHPGSTDGGLAMMSAAKLGHFWPFTLLMYKSFDSFCPKLLPDWAVQAGMDRTAFERAFTDPKTRDALVASKQEGIRNKVNATPTLFIDGHPYLYNLDIASVIDVLEEAYDNATAKP